MTSPPLPEWVQDTATVLSAPGVSRDHWLKVRGSGLGASDMSGVLGVSPYAGPFDVWLDKTGRAPRRPTTRIQRFGQINEPLLREFYEGDTGFTVWHGENLILQHPEDTWLRYSPDGLVMEAPRLFEGKTARRDNEWDGEASDHAEAQVVSGQAVIGPNAMTADIAVMIAGDVDSFTIYPIEYQQAAIDMVREQAAAFWHDHVLTDVPPPPDFRSLDAVLEYIGPSTRHTTLTVTGDQADTVRHLVAQYREARAGVKANEQAMGSIKAELLLIAGESEVIIDGDVGDRLFTYKSQTSRRVTNTALLAAGLDPEDYKTESHSRVFRP